jgi:hypothetical protein
MAARMTDVRRFALSLPDVTEEPHFHLSSFRVRGKIFATVPPEEKHIHIFLDEPEREVAVATNPRANDKLWWGKSVVGVRVTVSAAKLADVKALLEAAWEKRAPKALKRRVVERR